MKRKYDYQYICDLYLGGLKLTEISQKTGISVAQAQHVLNINNISTKQVGRCNHTIFSSITTEEQAYWLGFLTADGNIYINNQPYRTKNTVSLGLSYKDIGHLEKFKNFTETSNKIYVDKNKIKSHLSFSSKMMIDDLSKYHVVPRKTFVAKPYVFNDENLQRHYWRGIIDGDGYVLESTNSRKQKVLGITGTKNICLGFKNWCLQFIETNAKVRPHSSIYTFKVVDNNAIKIAEQLYANSTIYLDRKYDKAMKWIV